MIYEIFDFGIFKFFSGLGNIHILRNTKIGEGTSGFVMIPVKNCYHFLPYFVGKNLISDFRLLSHAHNSITFLWKLYGFA